MKFKKLFCWHDWYLYNKKYYSINHKGITTIGKTYELWICRKCDKLKVKY